MYTNTSLTVPVQFGKAGWFRCATMAGAVGALLATGWHERGPIAQEFGDRFVRDGACLDTMNALPLSDEQRNVLCTPLYLQNPEINTVADLYQRMLETSEAIPWAPGIDPPKGFRLAIFKDSVIEQFADPDDQAIVKDAFSRLYAADLLDHHLTLGGAIKSFAIPAIGEDIGKTFGA